MAELGIDIAWARPTVAQIKATGAKWVVRYLSTDSSKNLTAAEVREYAAAGIGTVVVWETTAGRATAGYAAGVSDARAAEAQRQADGLPAAMPIHFAVDEDVPWSSVAQYFAGAASVVSKALTGTYGGFKVIEGAHAAGYHYLWQTVAWSAGRWSQWATIRQTGGTVLSGGADVDYAEATDFGEYPRPTTPTKPPAPAPKPVPVPPPVITQEDPMYLVTVNEKDYPGGKGWPGVFLLTSAGTLRHIVGDTPDLGEVQKLKLPAITFSKKQYDSWVAGK